MLRLRHLPYVQTPSPLPPRLRNPIFPNLANVSFLLWLQDHSYRLSRIFLSSAKKMLNQDPTGTRHRSPFVLSLPRKMLLGLICKRRALILVRSALKASRARVVMLRPRNYLPVSRLIFCSSFFVFLFCRAYQSNCLSPCIHILQVLIREVRTQSPWWKRSLFRADRKVLSRNISPSFERSGFNFFYHG